MKKNCGLWKKTVKIFLISFLDLQGWKILQEWDCIAEHYLGKFVAHALLGSSAGKYLKYKYGRYKNSILYIDTFSEKYLVWAYN